MFVIYWKTSFWTRTIQRLVIGPKRDGYWGKPSWLLLTIPSKFLPRQVEKSHEPNTSGIHGTSFTALAGLHCTIYLCHCCIWQSSEWNWNAGSDVSGWRSKGPQNGEESVFIGFPDWLPRFHYRRVVEWKWAGLGGTCRFISPHILIPLIFS